MRLTMRLANRVARAGVGRTETQFVTTSFGRSRKTTPSNGTPRASASKQCALRADVSNANGLSPPDLIPSPPPAALAPATARKHAFLPALRPSTSSHSSAQTNVAASVTSLTAKGPSAPSAHLAVPLASLPTQSTTPLTRLAFGTYNERESLCFCSLLVQATLC
jgi:hypothetical protein